jgi:hypothetical protein
MIYTNPTTLSSTLVYAGVLPSIAATLPPCYHSTASFSAPSSTINAEGAGLLLISISSITCIEGIGLTDAMPFIGYSLISLA